jgi:hypothetical protein
MRALGYTRRFPSFGIFCFVVFNFSSPGVRFQSLGEVVETIPGLQESGWKKRVL